MKMENSQITKIAFNNNSQVTKIAFNNNSQNAIEVGPISNDDVIYRNGKEANAILFATKKGSDYVLVLKRYWDSYFGCYIEDRAWVKTAFSVGNGLVAITTEKSHTVCTKNVPTCEEINKVAKTINELSQSIITWSKQKELAKGYLNNEKHKAWASQQYAKADYCLNNYQKTVANYRNWLNQVAPK
jgi:hypothetical protein